MHTKEQLKQAINNTNKKIRAKISQLETQQNKQARNQTMTSKQYKE